MKETDQMQERAQRGAGECHDIRAIMNRVGDKWSIQVIGVLSAGPMRFNRLRRELAGISQRMLTLTLRLLERDGLVSRHILHTAPPSVEYRLTPLGGTLTDPLRVLSQWARDHSREIRQAQTAFDTRDEMHAASG